MERDFEAEFRELKQSEIPDLWNRIEAALPEKRAEAAFPGKRMAVVSSEKKIGDASSVDRQLHTAKKKTSWRNWGILAAACLCAVIVFPAVMLGLVSREKSSGSDMALPDSAGSAETEDSFADMWESESGAASETQESAAGAAGSVQDAGKEYSADEMEGADETADGVQDKDTEKEYPLILTDGQILENVAVKIVSAEGTMDESIYKALVEKGDADGILECEMQIVLVCNEESQYAFPRSAREELALKKGESYVVTLQYGKPDSIEEGEGALAFFVVDAAMAESSK